MTDHAEPKNDRLKEFLHRWIVSTLGVLVAVNLDFTGISYDTPEGLVIATLVLGVLNAFLRPLLVIGCLPLLILTLGLFLLVINALLLYFAGQLVTQFHVPDFWSAFKGALVISLVTLIANHLTGGGGTRVTTRQQPRDRPPLLDDDDGPVIDV